MDFLFVGIDDDEEPMTEEEQAARKAKEEDDCEVQRLRQNEEMDRERQKRLKKKLAEEERWYPKQKIVLELEECFKQNALLMNGNDKEEFLEFIPQFTALFKKDVHMMKQMKKIKGENDLKKFLTTWYNNLEFGTSETERLDEFLAKFEKQVMVPCAKREIITIVNEETRKTSKPLKKVTHRNKRIQKLKTSNPINPDQLVLRMVISNPIFEEAKTLEIVYKTLKKSLEQPQSSDQACKNTKPILIVTVERRIFISDPAMQKIFSLCLVILKFLHFLCLNIFMMYFTAILLLDILLHSSFIPYILRVFLGRWCFLPSSFSS